MRICVINPFAGTEFFGRENLEAVAAPGTEFDMVDIGERYPLTNNQWLFFKHSCTGPTIDRAIEADRLRRENEELRLRAGTANELIGQSQAIREVKESIDRVAPVNSRVLITGPAGSGKEVVARMLHSKSQRAKSPFVVVNCATMLPERFEIELFGAENPSAEIETQQKVGTFEAAHNGTLFLDEVADMDLSLQAQLLLFLKQRGNADAKAVNGADIRILCASHRDLGAMTAAGTFREDLYYRLAEVVVRIPALKDRPGDPALLARHFLNRLADDLNPQVKGLAPDALAALDAWSWPGNVRELENLIRRLAALYSQEVITVEDIEAELANASPENTEDKEKGLSQTVENLLSTYFSAHADGLPAAGLYQRVLREVERPLITLTLQATQGNQIRAAEVLGLNRNTLRKKIRQLNIPIVRGAK